MGIKNLMLQTLSLRRDVKWNLSWETTAMGDHLSWKTILWWLTQRSSRPGSIYCIVCLYHILTWWPLVQWWYRVWTMSCQTDWWCPVGPPPSPADTTWPGLPASSSPAACCNLLSGDSEREGWGHRGYSGGNRGKVCTVEHRDMAIAYTVCTVQGVSQTIKWNYERCLILWDGLLNSLNYSF